MNNTSKNKKIGAETPPARDIFRDPALAESTDNDPLVKFIVKNSKYLIALLIAAPLIFFGINNYQETNLLKRQSATRLYSEIRDQFSNYQSLQIELTKARVDLEKAEKDKKTELESKIKKDEDTLREGRQRADKMIQSLGDTAIEPFVGLARLYAALFAIQDGDVPKAQNLIGTPQWESAEAGTPERYVGELSELVAARSLLNDPLTEDSARVRLIKLASNGTTAKLSAALTLARVAHTDEQKKGATDILNQVKQAQPEQAKYIDPVLEQLK